MAESFGPIDQMLSILLETWEHRYAFDVDRERQVALFTCGGMQAVAGMVEGGLIRVAYESALHEVAEEFCTTHTHRPQPSSTPSWRESSSAECPSQALQQVESCWFRVDSDGYRVDRLGFVGFSANLTG
jgi:hypothetical protein